MGCYSQKELTALNPTSYIFEANIEQVRKSIIAGLGDYKMKCLALYSKEDYENDVFNTNIRYDALLNSFCSFESKIYFRFNKPLYYQASFHLHLDSISENRTKVEVFTLNPNICTWGFPFGSTGHGYSHTKKVSPSTIEEYEILLAIGKQLGEKNMPACNYPKKWLEYQAKQQKR